MLCFRYAFIVVGHGRWAPYNAQIAMVKQQSVTRSVFTLETVAKLVLGKVQTYQSRDNYSRADPVQSYSKGLTNCEPN